MVPAADGVDQATRPRLIGNPLHSVVGIVGIRMPHREVTLAELSTAHVLPDRDESVGGVKVGQKLDPWDAPRVEMLAVLALPLTVVVVSVVVQVKKCMACARWSGRSNAASTVVASNSPAWP